MASGSQLRLLIWTWKEGKGEEKACQCPSNYDRHSFGGLSAIRRVRKDDLSIHVPDYKKLTR